MRPLGPDQYRSFTRIYPFQATYRDITPRGMRGRSRSLNDFVTMLHVDYSYDGSGSLISKVLLIGTRRWMEGLWKVVLHPEKAVPFDGTRERIRSFGDPPFPAEKMVKQQVHQHLLVAQKLWADAFCRFFG